MKRTPWNDRKIIAEGRRVNPARAGTYRVGKKEDNPVVFERARIIATNPMRASGELWGARGGEADQLFKALEKNGRKLTKIENHRNEMEQEKTEGTPAAPVMSLKAIKAAIKRGGSVSPDTLLYLQKIVPSKTAPGKTAPGQMRAIGVLVKVIKTIPGENGEPTQIEGEIVSTVATKDTKIKHETPEIIKRAIGDTYGDWTREQWMEAEKYEKLREEDTPVIFTVDNIRETSELRHSMEAMSVDEVDKKIERLQTERLEIASKLADIKNKELKRLESLPQIVYQHGKIDTDRTDPELTKHIFQVLAKNWYIGKGWINADLIATAGKNESNWIALVITGAKNGVRAVDSIAHVIAFAANSADSATPLFPECVPTIEDLKIDAGEATREEILENPYHSMKIMSVYDQNTTTLAQWDRLLTTYNNRILKSKAGGAITPGAGVEEKTGESQNWIDAKEAIESYLDEGQLVILRDEGFFDEQNAHDIERRFSDLLRKSGRYEELQTAKDAYGAAEEESFIRWALMRYPILSYPTPKVPDPNLVNDLAQDVRQQDKSEEEAAAILKKEEEELIIANKGIGDRQKEWLQNPKNIKSVIDKVSASTEGLHKIKETWKKSFKERLNKLRTRPNEDGLGQIVIGLGKAGPYELSLAKAKEAQSILQDIKEKMTGEVVDISLSEDQKQFIAAQLEYARKKDQPEDETDETDGTDEIEEYPTQKFGPDLSVGPYQGDVGPGNEGNPEHRAVYRPPGGAKSYRSPLNVRDKDAININQIADEMPEPPAPTHKGKIASIEGNVMTLSSGDEVPLNNAQVFEYTDKGTYRRRLSALKPGIDVYIYPGNNKELDIFIGRKIDRFFPSRRGTGPNR